MNNYTLPQNSTYTYDMDKHEKRGIFSRLSKTLVYSILIYVVAVSVLSLLYFSADSMKSEVAYGLLFFLVVPVAIYLLCVYNNVIDPIILGAIFFPPDIEFDEDNLAFYYRTPEHAKQYIVYKTDIHSVNLERDKVTKTLHLTLEINKPWFTSLFSFNKTKIVEFYLIETPNDSGN